MGEYRPYNSIEENAAEDPLSGQRRRFAFATMLFGALLLGAFTPFDLFLTGYMLDATAEAIGCVLLLVAAWKVRRQGLTMITIAMVALVAAGVTATVVLGGRAGDGVVVWVTVFPMLPFFMLGLRGGLVTTVLFGLALTGGMAADVGLGGQAGYSWVAVVNLGAALMTGTCFAFFYEASRHRAALELRRAALTDALTGLPNRRALMQAHDREAARADRYGRPLALLILDLDHFKAVNDRYGHDTGDAVLCQVAGVARQCLNDDGALICRLGGEEFAVLLPGTDLAGARQEAERLRLALEGSVLVHKGETVRVTVSIGVAVSDPVSDPALGPGTMAGTTGAVPLRRPGSFAALFDAADRNLYRAKHNGRNRVECAA